MDYAVNLFFVLIGYRSGARSPIFFPRLPLGTNPELVEGFARDQVIKDMVDPLPQAVVLTSIVIGLAVTLLLVAIAIRIYEKYGTFDITKINKLKG